MIERELYDTSRYSEFFDFQPSHTHHHTSICSAKTSAALSVVAFAAMLRKENRVGALTLSFRMPSRAVLTLTPRMTPGRRSCTTGTKKGGYMAKARFTKDRASSARVHDVTYSTNINMIIFSILPPFSLAPFHEFGLLFLSRARDARFKPRQWICED